MSARPPSAGDQCWTLVRIAEVVRHRFGVEYALAGLELLHRIGWSVRAPSRRATECDEEKIVARKDEQWPVIRIRRRRRTWALGPVSNCGAASDEQLVRDACRPGPQLTGELGCCSS
jgi:hypothetical protein